MTTNHSEHLTLSDDTTTEDIGTLAIIPKFLDARINIGAPTGGVLGSSSITVTGTVSCDLHVDLAPGEPDIQDGIQFVTKVEVRFNNGAYQMATRVGSTWASWTFTGSAGSASNVAIEARVTAEHSVVPDDIAFASVDVQVDTAGPQLTVNPINDITKSKPPYTASIGGTVSDSPAGIKRVEYRIGISGSFTTATRSGSNWSGSVTLPDLGSHTLTVRAFDNVNNLTTRTRTIVVRDATAPVVTITAPPEGAPLTWADGGVTLPLRGTASDTQTGITKVEWALNNQSQFTQATPTGPGGSWASWSADILLPSAQEHTVVVRAHDGAGNPFPIQRLVVVIMPFEPRDPLDVVSLPSYLDDLIGFATLRIRAAPGGAFISRAALAAAFHQPFDALTGLEHRRVANQFVHQNRVCIEVLRGYLAAHNRSVPAAVEASYAQAAYQALLRNLGAAHDELRLARVANAETRAALASRLGFSLSPARPDELDRLTLQLDQVTQADLQRLLGLVDTQGNPLASVELPPSELLTWRLEQLRALWLQQDDAGRSAVGTALPIIDPDLIGIDDLKVEIRTEDNPVYDLLHERQGWVGDRLAALLALRDAAPNALAGFDALAGSVFGSVDSLLTLFAGYQQGNDIKGQLREVQLQLQPFLYLMRFRDLAANAPVFGDEWTAIFSILTQVQKLRQAGAWRAEERERNLTLGPDSFIIPGAEIPAPVLPEWRASRQARQAWQDTLRARIEQEQVSRQALLAAVAEAENATLPVLRDALVAVIDPAHPVAEVANRLTQELLIDVGSGETQRATRVNHAIQTLQGVLFGMRTGHFDTLTPVLPPHPAAGWSPSFDEAQFDEEWGWMGAYATWRAAMFVFGYPENYLLPVLRPAGDQTGAFKSLLGDVRSQSRLTPDQARTYAADYLTRLRNDATISLPAALKQVSFAITDQLSAAQLAARRTLVQQLFTSGNIGQPHEIPNYLAEVFFFVPVLLAQQLQQSGQYLAALDWFQSVYAYNFPTGERKIYCGLKLEENITSAFGRTDDWLLTGLNPHELVTELATRRRHAYTRSTLMSLVRCFLEFADSEFTRDTYESLPRARALYVTALDLINQPEMGHDPASLFPPNPLVQSLRLHAELNLLKLRGGRNIAGMERQVESDLPQNGAINGLPIVGNGGGLVPARPTTLRPTPYRYAVLIERAKQLVNIAQQIEAAFLAALEKRDAEAYNLLRARQDVELARAGVRLQDVRNIEAQDGVALANLQRDRARFQAGYFQDLLDEGLIGPEQAALDFMNVATDLQVAAGVLFGVNTIHSGIQAGLTFGLFGNPAAALGQALGALAGAASSAASTLQVIASYERRRQEWRFQHNLSQHDLRLSDQQIVLAQDQVRVVQQERQIAQIQAHSADETVSFLAGKFTNVELYEWMSGVLGQVYSYFLQQATAMAQLAQNQLAFERQETPPAFIQSDYWQVSSEDGGATNGRSPDRRGLTGSARLLQDVFQLDQYAFETNKRKLQLSQTFSLAQLSPAEFQRFRESGRLTFATPMELFDRAFPGHYLRLIKRVRTSIIALIPPVQGIRATLTSSGLSRVDVGGELFQTVVIRRDPEQVALTAPNNATGLLELELEGELLLPFEGSGVDTTWELQLPRAANDFDFNSIADVLVSIDYTALPSAIYRQQVIQRLDRAISAERPFSFRQQFADQWYDLHNPDQTAMPLTVRFETRREDFPPNVEDLRIQHVLLYVVRARGATFELPVEQLHFTEQGDDEAIGGGATTVDGVISTRRGNGASWLPFTANRSPIGAWELVLPNTPEVRARFQDEEIEDILFVVTYQGRTPEWPE